MLPFGHLFVQRVTYRYETSPEAPGFKAPTLPTVKERALEAAHHEGLA